jgi:hypothetical protein
MRPSGTSIDEKDLVRSLLKKLSLHSFKPLKVLGAFRACLGKLERLRFADSLFAFIIEKMTRELSSLE